jgi:hypothetical protein
VSDNTDWDCPTCGRPTPTEIDVECHCGMTASHHVSISTMCKRLREAQQRESALIVRNKKLEDEVNEQARLLGRSGERECDLRGKIDRLERDLENRRDLFKLQEHLSLEQLAAERALADQLGIGLMSTWCLLSTFPEWHLSRHSKKFAKSIATWKEARGES